jgi:trehalose 6-phosphate synthase
MRQIRLKNNFSLAFLTRLLLVISVVISAYFAIWHYWRGWTLPNGDIEGENFLLSLACLLLSVATLALWVHRWSIKRPVDHFASIMGALVKGDFSKARKLFRNSEFAPFAQNLEEMLQQLEKHKSDRVVPLPNSWTPTRLRQQVRQQFGNGRICVIANREPCIHNRKGRTVETVFPASGLVTAVEPIVRACSGLWIGHGSGTADQETADEQGMLLVPPHQPEYALKRVWLTKEEEEGYYYGFSNEGMWPLCHIVHTRPLFRSEDWKHYQGVNRKFAKAFAEGMKGSDRPIALAQDYHFALLPQMIKEEVPKAVVSLFWHIPWPNPEVISICPWKNEILEGMIAADLIGFHTQYHCNNFLDSADKFLEARVDRERFSITSKGHTCYVKPFPISIEWPPKHDIEAAKIPEVRAEVMDELGLKHDIKICVGVDRLDYTKGIIERFLAVEKLLEQHPELIGRFVMVQISAPSRTHIRRYQDLDAEIRELVGRINFKFRRDGVEPIIHRLFHHDSKEIFRFYRAADVCMVSSLHDGMNLVAKEFVASRVDNGGSLVLSSFTGAAKELTDAFIVNPYDIENSAVALHQALMLDSAEKSLRMSRLRAEVLKNNVYTWAGHFLNEIHRIAEERANQKPPGELPHVLETVSQG